MSTPRGISPHADAFLVASCYAHPENDEPTNTQTLPAGVYQFNWAIPSADPQVPKPSYFYDPWKQVLHANADELQDLPTESLLLFVHGFNNAPINAFARGEGFVRSSGLATAIGRESDRVTPSRAAQTAQGLKDQLSDHPEPGFKHLIAYTWPTAHSVWPGYILDKVQVTRFAAYALANLIVDLRIADPGRPLLLIAHSMGCFLTLKALNTLAVQRADEELPATLVNQMIFYAPDVNADALQVENTTARQGYGSRALDRVGRLTVYTSRHDNALIWSPFANVVNEESGGVGGGVRLGFCGLYNRELTHKNVTALDCSSIIYDHSDYFVQPCVVRDTAERLSEKGPFEPYAATQDIFPQGATECSQPERKYKRKIDIFTPGIVLLEKWEEQFLCPTTHRRRSLAYLLLLPLYLMVLFPMVTALVFRLFGDLGKEGVPTQSVEPPRPTSPEAIAPATR